MVSQSAAAAAAATTTSGWTSFFDLDLQHFRGRGKDEIQSFSRELHSELPDAPADEAAKRRLVDRAKAVEEEPDRSEYALAALADGLPTLLNVVRGWPSADISTLFHALRQRWTQMCTEERYNLRLESVVDWATAHQSDPDRADAVAACITVDAPVEVDITRRLSKAGSQKVVFEAKWTVADDPTEIVLKKLQEGMQDIFERELRPHPLSMRHPNIIETYWLANQARRPERFLVERRLRPLRNSQRVSGESEAARLFVDLMRALTFLEDQGLVHGDVKPDNIAYSDGRYVLLDFGICRPAPDFERPEATATGSLRTRAPEVLLGADHNGKSDVWAAGATVFNMLVGRFPLWRLTDPPLPTLQEDHSGERAKAEERLRRRVKRGYEKNLAPLKALNNRAFLSLLGDALERRPVDRPTARELLAKALEELPSLIGQQEGPIFAAKDEILEMRRFFSQDARELALMSDREREDVRARLELLRRGLNAERHYQRRAKRLSREIRRELLLEPVDDADTAAAVDASAASTEYISRADQKIDAVWDEVLQRFISPPPRSSDDKAAPIAAADLVTTLHQLAATAVGRRDKVATALGDFEALIKQSS